MDTHAKQLYPHKSKEFELNRFVTIRDLELFKSELLLSFKCLITDLKNKEPKKWLKSYEVMNLLQISKNNLQTLRSNGTIPFSKIGGIIYYDAEEINSILLTKKKQLIPGAVPRLKKQ